MNTIPEVCKPILDRWVGKLKVAAKHKRREFQDTADQCMQFYAGGLNFMWDPVYMQKYMKRVSKPTFQTCLNKAFELVAIQAPMLYHRSPIRVCKTFNQPEFTPDIFGTPTDPQSAQMIMQAFSQAQAQQGQEWAVKRMAAQLMEMYLRYTPREQPDGGLAQAGEDAITEALVKGRGVLWPASYRNPGSERLLTGCFYDTVDALLVDPDATSMDFGNARWVAREHINAHWELEDRFGWPRDSLKRRGTAASRGASRLESGASQGENSASGDLPLVKINRERGKTFDLIRWYEIWSIGGIGGRFSGIADDEAGKALDEWVGDFAYLCLTPDVPCPLNLPPEALANADEQAVKKAFSWPIPLYADQRWPCAVLDFYKKPNSSWPVALLGTGLAELTLMNVFISAITNRVWYSGKVLIACLQSAKADVEKALNSEDDVCIIGLQEIHKSLDLIISQFQAADVSPQMFDLLDRLAKMFAMRTGLDESMYGMAQSPGERSATQTASRRQAQQVRTDHMQKKVDEFMSEAARIEKQVAYWSGVSGKDVQPLLGSVGAGLWDQIITNADPETIIREMDATVESGSSRRPDKDRDLANINQMMPSLLPLLQGYAMATGDTSQVNGLIDLLGKSLDQETKGLLLGPWVLPTPQGPMPQPAADRQAQTEDQAARKQDQDERDEAKRQDQDKRDEAKRQDQAKRDKTKSKGK